MFALTDIFFWLNFIYFLFVVIVAFIIPGVTLLHRLQLSTFQRIILGNILGIVLWSLQGFVFGFIGFRWLTYIYLGIFLLLWVKIYRTKISLERFRNIKLTFDPLLLILITLGTAIQLIILWFMGVYTEKGLFFCCFWPDSFYHLSLTNSLVRSFPPLEPGVGGILVQNYHYLANLVVAELVRIFKLPLVSTQYHYSTFYMTILLGCVAIVFCQLLKMTKTYTRWLLFFLFFSGDIIPIILFLLGKEFNFSLVIGERATTIWFSPPRFFAMVIFLGGFSLFLYWIKNKDIKSGLLTAVILGSLIGFKVYFGIFTLLGLGFLGVYFLWRKNYTMVFPIVATFLVSILIFLPVNKNAGGLSFVGTWRIEDYAVQPAVGLLRFELARAVYLAHHNYIKVFLIEIIFFLLYFVSFTGMFLLGFIQNKKSFSLFPRELHIVFLPSLLLTFILGIFFFQKIGGGNTVQFLFMIYIIGSFYAALSCSYWVQIIKYTPVKLLLIFSLVVLISMRVFYETETNIKKVINSEDAFFVENSELKALNFVKNNLPNKSTLLVDEHISVEDTCYYITFLIPQQVFLCGYGILLDHGVNPKTRRETLHAIFTGKNIKTASQALVENNIDYIYIVNTGVFGTGDMADIIEQVFGNEKIKIFKVLKDRARQKYKITT